MSSLAPNWSSEVIANIQRMMEQDSLLAHHGPLEKCLEPYRCETAETPGGLSASAHTRHHHFLIDEPKQFGGTDAAPNPVEAVLGALGASLQITARLYALHWKLPIRHLRCEISGTMDIRGFFGADSAIPAGLVGMSAILTIDSTMTQEQFARLAAQVRASCPVLSLVGGPSVIDTKIILENSA
jgi:uncharacterized OsmC-like protein